MAMHVQSKVAGVFIYTGTFIQQNTYHKTGRQERKHMWGKICTIYFRVQSTFGQHDISNITVWKLASNKKHFVLKVAVVTPNNE